MPSASFSHRVAINASPEAVWARLQEAEAWAAIGPIDEVWGARHDSEGALQAFQWSTRAAGRSFKGTASTSQSILDERMVVDLVTSEVVGAVDVELGDGALEVTMSLRSVGLLATVFFGVVSDSVGAGLGGHVDQFAAQFG